VQHTPWIKARWFSTGISNPLPFHETSCGVLRSMASKKRWIVAFSSRSGSPMENILMPSSSRATHEMTMTRCRCAGRKSLPVCVRRFWNAT
jgi:hypothetical protein